MLEQDRSGPDFLIFGEKLGLSNLSATRMTVSLLGRLTQAVNATSRMPSRCCFPIIVATVRGRLSQRPLSFQTHGHRHSPSIVAAGRIWRPRDILQYLTRHARHLGGDVHRHRTLLEAYAIGCLCPKYLGTGAIKRRAS